MLSICLIGIISSFLFNEALIKVQNYNISYPAQVLYSNVERGFLNECEPSSDIVMNGAYYCCGISTYQDIFKTAAKRDFQVSEIYRWKPDTAASASRNCYLLSCQRGDTIFTKLFKLSCQTGERLELLKSDTVVTGIKLTDVEKPILQLRD
jgi:hypothetical protein